MTQTSTPAPTLGEQLDEIGKRMQAATDAWVAAGRPLTGREFDTREAVFADLRVWTARVTGRHPHGVTVGALLREDRR